MSHARVARGEQGSALLLALFFTILALGLVAVGSTILRSHRTKTETAFRHNSQAMQFARSGLTEAVAWFRRQTAQPVLDFRPIVDPAATPPITDTDDPEIGLVREFRIAGTIWGRYEVWRQWDADPNPERLAFRRQLEVRDVSVERRLGTPGTAWRLRSIGYVFQRTDAGKRFDELPNRVLSQQMLETEILRLKMSPPAQAAICIREGASCTIAANTRVRGGPTGAGVCYLQGTGTPSVSGSVTGNPGLSPTSSYDASVPAVFGISLPDLKSIADEVVSQPATFPNPLPLHGLVVADAGPLMFDAARPLRGSAVLFVRGDVLLAPGSGSHFTGLLYVDGDVTIRAPALMAGCVVVADGHTITVQGSSDWIDVDFDEAVLATLRQEVGQYRMAGAIRPILHME